MKGYLVVLLVACAVTYLTTPIVRRLATALGAMTEVRGRDVHQEPTVRLGGLAMLAGLAAAMVVASQVPFLQQVLAGPGPWAILGSAVLLCLVGAIDDMWGLDAYTRLAAQILAGLLLAWFGGVQIASLPILGVTVGSGTMFLILTIGTVVVTVNAVNFIDGLDGLAAGVIAIAAAAFFFYTYALTRQSSPTDYSSLAAVITAALVGICLGFLPHNFNPARIFMGDSGSYLLGTILAAVAVVVTGQVDPTVVSRAQLAPAFAPLLLPLAVLLLPLADFVLAVIRRVADGKSPFAADRLHLHHRLLALGHSHRRAVLIMYVWTAVVAFGAVIASFAPATFAWISGLIALPGAIAVTFWTTHSGVEQEDS